MIFGIFKSIFNLFFTLIFLVGAVQSQDITYEWANGMGGTDTDVAYSIKFDGFGNLYVTGYFSGQMDFDPGSGSAVVSHVGGYDVFLAKYDSLGNFIWVITMGGTQNEIAYSLQVDNSGNVFIAGFFSDTVDFDPGSGVANLISAGNNDVFIAKYDSSGNYIWAKGIGGVYEDLAYSLELDEIGNIYIAGYYFMTADFDPGPGTAILNSAGNLDGFFAKYDPTGNYIWAKSIGGPNTDMARSIHVNGMEGVYITGDFNGTADFDPGPDTVYLPFAGYTDVFLAKYDTAGNYIWAKSMGGTDMEYGVSLKTDPTGNIYLMGYYRDSADFDPSSSTAILNSAGGSDIFLAKYDPSGSYVWAKSIGGTNYDYGGEIFVDRLENIYVTGYFNDSIDFDLDTGTTVLISEGFFDIFIAKYKSSGSCSWAINMGGVNNDMGYALDVERSGTVYVTGGFSGTADFDPGPGTTALTSSGNYDIFISKYSQCPPTVSLPPLNPVCENSNSIVLTDGSPLGGVYSGNGVTSGSFTPSVAGAGIHSITYSYTNTSGCSASANSNITVIASPDSIVTISENTLTANASGASYQWINCDNANLTISGETGQSYTPTANGNYAVIVSESGCSDTSACYSITNVGMETYELEASLQIYPNPVSYTLSIVVEKATEIANVQLFNMLGAKVREQNFANSKVELDIQDMPAGVYMLKVMNGGQQEIVRIVKR